MLPETFTQPIAARRPLPFLLPRSTDPSLPAPDRSSGTPRRRLVLLTGPTPVSPAGSLLQTVRTRIARFIRMTRRTGDGPQRHLDRGFLLLALTSAAALLLLSSR